MSIKLITLITQRKSITQAELSRILGVSKVQITKWKNGEPMPDERRQQILDLIGMTETEFVWYPYATDADDIKVWVEFLMDLQDEFFPFLDLGGFDEDDSLPAILDAMQNYSVKIPSTADLIEIFNTNRDGNDFVHLVKTVLASAGRLAFWANKYTGHAYYGAFHQYHSSLINQCVPVAMYHIDIDEFESCILDKDVFEQKRQITSLVTEILIDSWCQDAVSRAIPIAANYFDFLSVPPNELTSQFEPDAESRPRNIMDHYSLPEKQILFNQMNLSKVLFELHRKIDCLLTSDMKDTLEPVLEITKPFFPYPPENKPS